MLLLGVLLSSVQKGECLGANKCNLHAVYNSFPVLAEAARRALVLGVKLSSTQNGSRILARSDAACACTVASSVFSGHHRA